MAEIPSTIPEQWQRPAWQEGDYPPFLFTVIYGSTTIDVPVDAKRYRTRGLPESVEAHAFHRATHADYLRTSFEEGYAWDAFLREDPKLANAVRKSPGAIAFSGEVKDSTSLLYLRDVIGMTAYLLDHGGVAVYDTLTFTWFRPDVWKKQFFEPDAVKPQDHVRILYSNESDGLWLHTRGLLKFGRPDLSVRGVAAQHLETAGRMINELIDLQVAGTFLREELGIRDPNLGRFVVRYEGDRDDPEFNNVHIELVRSRS